MKTGGRRDDSIEEHRAILAALEHADAALAGHLLGLHVRRIGEVVVAALGGRGNACRSMISIAGRGDAPS